VYKSGLMSDKPFYQPSYLYEI